MTIVTVQDSSFDTVGASTDLFVIGDFSFSNREAFANTPSTYTYTTDGAGTTELDGVGFTYDSNGELAGGTITGIKYFGELVGTSQPIDPLFMSGLNIKATDYYNWGLSGGDALFKAAAFGGADTFQGGALSDLLRSYDGDDSLSGAGGNDTLDGGLGDDTISGGIGNDNVIGGDGQNYLRGDDGDDSISGGSGFDDINGNKGNDTIDGGAGGGDWLVGGQGDDSITAHHSANILYGNLGNDTLHGGDGGDLIRGGQGDDVIVGGAGNDYISGDRGNDTESGGPGADIFHSFSGAGVDLVLDFSQAEGDRVMLDPGTTYTVSQVGQNTVVDMGNGDQVILQNVQLSTLKAGWIFEG
jgi:Ca2+-binding RTX toxin-like protein